MVLVLIHLIRWCAFVGYILLFFNPKCQVISGRVVPAEQYKAQREPGPSPTKLTCVWAGRTMISLWEGRVSCIFPFWKGKVSYIGV